MREAVRWYDRLALVALVLCAVAAASLDPAPTAAARASSARRLPGLKWSMDCRWLSRLPDAAR